MVRVPGAVYTLGDPGWRHTKPRTVSIESFLLATREVTRGEFARFVAHTGRAIRGEHLAPADLPMTGLEWSRAKEYTLWLSANTGRAYRLPTSDEWEAAARAAGATAFEWGDGEPPWAVRANLADRSALRAYGVFTADSQFPLADAGYDDGYAGPAPPGSFPPNNLGLHDLTGNVSEWCADVYQSDVLSGPGEYRVVRGSSFLTRRIAEVRVGHVIAHRMLTRHIGVGFRLARTE